MTELTMSEIKIIAIQILFMAIIGVFTLLYASEPITSSTAPTTAVNQTKEVSATDQSWITGLISVPSGLGSLSFITLLVISPFLVFDGIIALRFAKDIATKWV